MRKYCLTFHLGSNVRPEDDSHEKSSFIFSEKELPAPVVTGILKVKTPTVKTLKTNTWIQILSLGF